MEKENQEAAPTLWTTHNFQLSILNFQLNFPFS